MVTLADLFDVIDALASDLRDSGIHVGLGVGGATVRCVTCGERWPCPGSGIAPPADRSHPTGAPVMGRGRAGNSSWSGL